MPTLQRAAPTITGRAQLERTAQPPRHHPPEKGNEQAGNNSLQLGSESTPHTASAQHTSQPTKPSTKARPRTQHMLRPTRDPPFGAGHEQAKHVLGQMPTKNNQKKSDDREMLQKRAQAPTGRQLSQDHGENAMIRPQRLARNAPYQPLEEGYEQAGSSSSCDANLCPMPLSTQASCSRHNLPQTQSPGSYLGVCLHTYRPREEWVNNSWARRGEICKKKILPTARGSR